MDKFLRAIAPALLLSFLSAPARADEKPPTAAGQFLGGSEPPSLKPAPEKTGTPVSLERVLEIVRAIAPAISAARARVLQADGQRVFGTVLPDPQFSASVGRGEPRGGGASKSESGFELTQSFPAPWGLRARRHSGSARIQAARDEVEAVTAEVVLEAKRLYYEAAIDEAQALGLVQAAQDAQSLRDLVARRVDAGEAPEGDRLRTRVEALRTDLEARAAKAEAEGARAALNRFLLGALGSDFSLSSDLDSRRTPPSPENLVEAAISRSPAYKAALSRVEAAKWAASAERAARLPGLDLSVFREKEIDRQAAGATLGLTIPLWNRNRGSVGIAHGELAETQAEALNLRAQIEGEVERLMRRDRISRELAISYSQEIIPAAAETLSIARFSLEQGEASLLTWLEARRSYLEVLRASYGAHLEALITRAELERLSGEFNESSHP